MGVSDSLGEPSASEIQDELMKSHTHGKDKKDLYFHRYCRSSSNLEESLGFTCNLHCATILNQLVLARTLCHIFHCK